jgi:hypothetical protein
MFLMGIENNETLFIELGVWLASLARKLDEVFLKQQDAKING